MRIEDEVRRALKPLINQGVVHMVHVGSVASHNGVPSSSQHPPITVLVNADDPEEHRADIMKLVRQAGLGVNPSLHPNPSRPRG